MTVGLPHKPLTAGKAAGGGVRPRTFDRGDQRRLFAADELAGPAANLDPHEWPLPKCYRRQSALFRLADGPPDGGYGQRIFAQDVDVSLVGADGLARRR